MCVGGSDGRLVMRVVMDRKASNLELELDSRGLGVGRERKQSGGHVDRRVEQQSLRLRPRSCLAATSTQLR